MKKNILISGGTGSGKTSLLNALSTAIPDEERIVVGEVRSGEALDLVQSMLSGMAAACRRSTPTRRATL